MVLLSISVFLLVAYILLLLYYRKGWTAMPEFALPDGSSQDDWPMISVVIAARNEEKYIGACIRSLLNQTYPRQKFEIILTDDHSTDQTVAIVRSFQANNIKLLHLSDFIDGRPLNSYKKKSIDSALKVAKGQLVVTTDADCTVPERWLETLACFYREQAPVFVAMPVQFAGPSRDAPILKKLFTVFQSLDFMSLQGITGASVFKRVHAMCNGANLAYERDVFFDVGGFEGIDELASGDDMLLMHKIQQKYPHEIKFLKSKEVIVSTRPADTLPEFMNQRIRWASKAGRYTDRKITAVLLLIYLLNAWLLLLGLGSFFAIRTLLIFAGALLLKTGAELIFLFPVARFFGKVRLLWYFFPAQPFHILYTVVAGWLGKFGSYRWKGRKVK